MAILRLFVISGIIFISVFYICSKAESSEGVTHDLKLTLKPARLKNLNALTGIWICTSQKTKVFNSDIQKAQPLQSRQEPLSLKHNRRSPNDQ